MPDPSDMVMFGEMGLSGEVRGVSGAEQRVREAAKMGFKTCIIPRSNLDNVRDERHWRHEGGRCRKYTAGTGVYIEENIQSYKAR